MNGLRRSSCVGAAVLVAAGMLSGCRSAPRRTASAEPGMTVAAPTLGAPIEPDGTDVSTAPAGTGVAWYDRHPLFAKPRHYYDSTQSNKAVKLGVATVVGVPAGVFGELKQIVSGASTAPKY